MLSERIVSSGTCSAVQCSAVQYSAVACDHAQHTVRDPLAVGYHISPALYLSGTASGPLAGAPYRRVIKFQSQFLKDFVVENV